MGRRKDSHQIKKKEPVKDLETEYNPIVSQEENPRDKEKEKVHESTLDRFFKRMTKLEKEHDDQTEINDRNLQAMSEQTEKLFSKMCEDNKKTVEKVTKTMETLTTRMDTRYKERDREQKIREKERAAETDKRDEKQQKHMQKMFDKLGRRIAETERKLLEPNLVIENWTAFGKESNAREEGSTHPTEPPNPARREAAQTPQKRLGDPTTLEGQLCRGEITQEEYSTSVKEREPLRGRSEEARFNEMKERDQLLRDRINARRQEVVLETRRRDEEIRRTQPIPDPTARGVSKEEVQRAMEKAKELLKPMEETEIQHMEGYEQGPESPRRKREQSENSKNKKQREDDSQQMSDITYSDGSVFVEGFTPPDDTIQAQRGTDRLLREIKNGEDAKTTQRQADASRAEPEKADGETLTETIDDMVNPEVEIEFARPTPGAFTEQDMKENEERIEEEEAPDPNKLGKKP